MTRLAHEAAKGARGDMAALLRVARAGSINPVVRAMCVDGRFECCCVVGSVNEREQLPRVPFERIPTLMGKAKAGDGAAGAEALFDRDQSGAFEAFRVGGEVAVG